MHLRGGGGGGAWDGEYWLWPLPPPGPLAFVCEWPARGIPQTRSEVDASLVCDAAEQAEIIWPRVPSARGCGWSVRSYGAGSKYPPGQSV